MPLSLFLLPLLLQDKNLMTLQDGVWQIVFLRHLQFSPEKVI